ncbi:ABC transporter ATP-binding protein [Pseudomonas gingeri]|uniref:Spermidine/putrescine import ATP-binding protein PotA n=1 Tax=Pseudomonas gingeri TaxID=117681 RepID=A0A7Y7YEJ2_9PSED|nr:ABC transporter ATP-binding protein [Pseudomonas gingeri]NWA03307.1 ABC transporter ATP-binding protein [Pseudomonas gingeri]NWA14164.1 ABC transporter ATP-binding protein [Pseudomonas gingeri]NWA55218.1 ABC transporter ATP-binding protein [Pseudomonas gingeri]NWA94942.1 ABC transporter ATP-binding protein [Pseudomonas gingeri]NWB01598.1 ABC transporter ATP-binding protein [Pseudomonas gingeri]
MNTASPYVRFRGVQKSYDGEQLVVKKLDLDIQRGEFLTLLGPSGSGKTTSLMMLAGFETPTEGEILLDGQPLHTVAPHKRGIGMVFQNYALFPHMTVARNLAFPLRVRRLGNADIELKVKRALDMVQLGHLADRYPAQLSGGQQQRIALARALVFEPSLVLMDEPLGALDKQLREQMQLEIRRLHRQLGLTVVFVTHDQAEALTLSDRVAVFNDGVIQQIDTPKALYEHPGNSFVAHFIGENNALPGTVISVSGPECRVRLADGSEVGARATTALPVGASTSLSIRPERVGLDKPSANSLPGRIEELIYLGDHVRVRLNVAGQKEFTAKIPIAEMQDGWSTGISLPVSWFSHDASALDPLVVH